MSENQHNQYLTAILVMAAMGACVYLAAIHSISGDLAITVILSALGITGTVRGAQVGGQLALTAPSAAPAPDTLNAPNRPSPPTMPTATTPPETV